MKNYRTMLVAILAASLVCFGWDQSAAQNLIVNGSFETPVQAASTIHAGDTTLTGWSIGGTRTIYLVRVPLSQLTNAVDGDQFVDLNGANGGVTLSQSFSTDVGEVYEAEFSVGQYQAPQILFKLQADILDDADAVLTNREVVAPQTLGWSTPTRLRFNAATSTSTLRFTDTNGTSNVDIMLDAVSVRRVTPHLTIEASPIRLCWETDTNYLYQIQVASQLTSNSWNNLGEPIPGSGDISCTELPASTSAEFFRVLVLP